MAHNIFRVKIIDPSLYVEIENNLNHMLIEFYDNEIVTHFIQSLFEQVNNNYYHHINYWSDSENYARMPILHYYNLPFKEFYDWESIGSFHWRAHIALIEHLFTNGFEELALIHIMDLMFHAVSPFAPDCAIWMFAALYDDISDALIQKLIDRIEVMKNDGFEIYKSYIEMLIDPKRVFDPVTQNIHHVIRNVIDERELINNM